MPTGVGIPLVINLAVAIGTIGAVLMAVLGEPIRTKTMIEVGDNCSTRPQIVRFIWDRKNLGFS